MFFHTPLFFEFPFYALHLLFNFSSYLEDYHSKAYVGHYQTSMMELFCKNSLRIKSTNYFCKKTTSYMFNYVIHTPTSFT